MQSTTNQTAGDSAASISDLIIVGAGPAGMTAAIYAARAGKSVTVLEGEAFGGQIASSPRVENYPGIASISGMDFSDALYAQASALGVQFEFARASALRPGQPFVVPSVDGLAYLGRSVILACGSHHRPLGLPGEKALVGHGVSYCAICDGAFYKNADVAVVGGGSAALQSAEYLCSVCRSVTLIHRRDAFRGETSLAQRVTQNANLTLCLNHVVTDLAKSDAGVLCGITVKDTQTGEPSELSVTGLFPAVGQLPGNAPFAETVKLDDAGYILAAEDCLTSQPGVFAAGDCRRKAVRQLTTAAADGTVAALAACAWVDALPGAK